MIGTAGLAILIALRFRSVVDIWHDLGSVGTPTLLVPLATSFSPRLRPSGGTALIMMLGGGLIPLLWLLWASMPWSGGEYPASVEPIFPGLLFSLAAYLVGRRNASSTRRPGDDPETLVGEHS